MDMHCESGASHYRLRGRLCSQMYQQPLVGQTEIATNLEQLRARGHTLLQTRIQEIGMIPEQLIHHRHSRELSFERANVARESQRPQTQVFAAVT